MTISFIREFHASSASAGTAASCTISVSPAAGNHIVATFSSSTNDTIPTPAGWTAIGTQTVDTTNIATFWKKAAGSETTVSATLAASGNWNIHYAEFNSTIAGNWAAGVVANNVPQSAGTALATGTTAATTKANALAWGTVTYAGARQTPSWSASFTSNTGTASATVVFALESAYKILSATGTQTSTDTVGVSVAAGWTGQIVTFYEPVLSAFAGTIVRPRRRMAFPRRRGPVVAVPLTQQPTPPPPYLAPTVRPTRRTTGLRRRPQPSVPLTQTGAAVAAPPPQIGRRRARGGLWARRRQQSVGPFVALVPVPQIATQRARRGLPRLRARQQPVVPVIGAVFTPAIVRPVRRGLWVRDRQMPVLPNQSAPATQAALVPAIASARARRGFARRGSLVTFTVTQTAAVAPPFVPAPSRPVRRSPWMLRRRQPVVPPASPVVTVTFTPAIVRPVRRGLWARGRVQPGTPLVVPAVVPAPSRPVRRSTWTVRRRQQPAVLPPVVVVAAPAHVAPVARLRRVFGWLRRRPQPAVPLTQTVAPVAVVLVPPFVAVLTVAPAFTAEGDFASSTTGSLVSSTADVERAAFTVNTTPAGST